VASLELLLAPLTHATGWGRISVIMGAAEKPAIQKLIVRF
jgi:hypothetical protein